MRPIQSSMLSCLLLNSLLNKNDPDFPSSNTAEAKHFPHFKFVSLHARSVWETICDAVASSSGINWC